MKDLSVTFITALGLVVLLFFCRPVLDAEASEGWRGRGQEMTKRFEGYRSEPYKDTLGIWHIGYGFRCDVTFPLHDMVLCGGVMTKKIAESIFSGKYSEAETLARSFSGLAWSVMSDEEKMVFTDMAYNLNGRLFNFKRLEKALLAGRTDAMISEMRDSRWYHQTGRRPEALIQMLMTK